MLIPDEKVHEVLETTDIVAVVGESVALQPKGRAFGGRCPFHLDAEGALAVWKEKGRFKCFACERGGDAIAFVMTIRQVGFVQAIDLLEKRAKMGSEGAVSER